jgi:Tfp pilus assembly protein PilV
MDNLHQRMQELNRQIEQQQAAAKQQQFLSELHTKRTTETVAHWFENIAKEYVKTGEHLSLEEAPPGTTGFTISYNKRTNSVRPNFAVSATCKGDNVDIHVTDDEWEQIDGQLGGWADWTDDKSIYSGPVDESALRKVLDKAFLEWYERSAKAPDENPQ